MKNSRLTFWQSGLFFFLSVTPEDSVNTAPATSAGENIIQTL